MGDAPLRDFKVERNYKSVVSSEFVTGVLLTALPFSKQLIDSEPQAKEQEVIEISSDEESVSKDEVKKENNNLKSIPWKKRTLSNSESATGPPSKRRITLGRVETAIEILDSDDEHPTAMKAIPTKAATAFSDTRPVKVESHGGAEKMALSINETAKDKEGRYIVTQKVKVDSIKNLQEVPARWPISPEGTNTAYVFDLNNDKKWQELDPNSKKKNLDRFIKQEVRPNIFMSLLKLSKPYYIILGSRFLGKGDQRFNQSSNSHPVP
jgi:hypothetical protein